LLEVEALAQKYGFPKEYVDLLKERGITHLNPVQRDALTHGLTSDKNLLVVAPTASGKTLIGELALVKSALEGGIGVYLVPLRALASEKYDEFQSLKRIGLKIGISTGDYESPAEYLGVNDIVVATYERFDSLLRLKPTWLKRVKCVVIDEMHNIGDPERGPIIEMIAARLMRSGVRIVGLSATIGNPHVIAKWLNAELINTPWRPVKLVEGYYDKSARVLVFFTEQGERVEKVRYSYGDPVLDVVMQSLAENIQVLVFVHNRRKAEEYAEKLVEYLGISKYLTSSAKLAELLEELRGSPSRIEREKLERLIRCGVGFHHAGLSSVARRVVEKGFRERVIKAVFATPTLAAGVNLPAKRVLVSIKRYDPSSHTTRNIPVFEYKQMAGRAGRPQYDPYGEAIIYDAKSGREAMSYIKGPLEPVMSRLGSERSLRIYTLALVASGEANTIDELIGIFEGTLYRALAGDPHFMRLGVERAIDQLEKWGMLKRDGSSLTATRLGKVTSVTYLDPLTTHRYLSNVSPKRHSTLYYLHVLTFTPDYVRSKPYVPAKLVESFEEEALTLADEGQVPQPPSDPYEYYLWLEGYVHAKILSDWIDEVDEDTIMQRYGIGPGDLYTASETAAWISGALATVERVLGNIERAEDLSKLSIRLENGVREDALELVKLEGIGRVRARILLSRGIKTLEDLARTPDHVLESLPGFGPKIVRNIKEQLKNML